MINPSTHNQSAARDRANDPGSVSHRRELPMTIDDDTDDPTSWPALDAQAAKALNLCLASLEANHEVSFINARKAVEGALAKLRKEQELHHDRFRQQLQVIMLGVDPGGEHG